jgi:hypothetical protein
VTGLQSMPPTEWVNWVNFHAVEPDFGQAQAPSVRFFPVVLDQSGCRFASGQTQRFQAAEVQLRIFEGAGRHHLVLVIVQAVRVSP